MSKMKESKPILTMRVRSKTLGEHSKAFENVNNPNGFQLEPNNEMDADSVGGILLELSCLPYVTKNQLGQLRRRLQTAIKHLKYTQAQTIVARALGYESAEIMGRYWDKNEQLPNKHQVTHRWQRM
jgi:hypothetical protein